MSLSFQKILLVGCVLAVLGVGAYARFTELGWHFTNSDDLGVAEGIVLNRNLDNYDLFTIPRSWTYAPFQFIFTSFLIQDNLTYRELLYWSRLPSCIFSILGLVLMFFFGIKYYRDQPFYAVLPVALLAFSWEAIIHSKQAHNYGIGSLAVVMIFYVLLSILQKKNYSNAFLILMGLILGITITMHYQSIVFLIAFYLLLIIESFFNEKKFIGNLKRIFIVGVTNLICFVPIWLLFLAKKITEGRGAPDTSTGLKEEFVFNLADGVGIFESLVYCLKFFTVNFFIVFQANISFVPEQHFLFMPVTVILFIFFILGIFSIFFMPKDKMVKKFIMIFIVLVMMVWFGLVVLNKLNLSPTRHSFVFTPMLCIGISAGMYFFGKIFRKESFELLYVGGIVSFSLIAFLMLYPTFLKERKDPFVEQEILNKLKEYDVGFLVGYGRNDGLLFMDSVVDYIDRQVETLEDPYKTIAWVGRSDLRFSREQCEKMRYKFNFVKLEEMKKLKKHLPVIQYPCDDYRLIYADRQPSDLQSDFSRKLQIPLYTKGFFFYIVRHSH